MSVVPREIIVRTAIGAGVIVGLALVAGLQSSVEPKPPLDLPMIGSATTPKIGATDIAVPSVKLPETKADTFAIAASASAAPAQSGASSAPSASARTDRAHNGGFGNGSSSAARFDVTSAERLTIKFQGYAELTGDYRVNPDETVSIPVLGRINVNGMTPAMLETALAERTAKLTGRDAYVTVEVSEYRPVFVTGYVNRPGASPWKPGMSVLQAVTMLGGLYRATTENAGGAVIGADVEIVRLKRATTDLKRVIANAARFQAERQDKDTIEVPARLISLVGKQEADRLIEEQTSALMSRRSGLSAQLASIERGRTIAEQELSGLKAQSGRLKEMLSQRREYKQKIEGLQAKGVVRADRGMEEASKLSDLEDRFTQTSVGIARVQGIMATLERDLINLKQERVAMIDTELLKLDREAALLELEIDAARHAYRKITGTPAPVSFADPEIAKAAVVEYEVVRQEGGKQVTAKVDQFAMLRPGDILMVSAKPD